MQLRKILSLVLILAGFQLQAAPAPEAQEWFVGLGKSQIIQFIAPVKRVSLANPEIADALVTSPSQILVNGKAVGRTTLVVWSESEEYRVYELVIGKSPAEYQVMLKVRFAEVNRTAIKQLGMNILFDNKDVQARSFAGKVNSNSQPLLLDDNTDLFLAIPSADLTSIIKALEEQRLLTTIAKPNLVAVDGTEATFLAGGEFPIPIVQGMLGAQTVTIQYKEFGIRLKFTPTVLDSGLVNIKVSTEVSSLDFENGIVMSGFRIPALTTRKSETSVELANGSHFVISGLLSSELAKNVSKVPGLGSIPLLGKLFSSERYQKNETELLVMIEPVIMESLEQKSIPELEQ